MINLRDFLFNRRGSYEGANVFDINNVVKKPLYQDRKKGVTKLNQLTLRGSSKNLKLA